MASPVDTSVKHFLSTMSGAPALSGTVGSMIALLDALLVTGFDTKTLTSLTVAAGVATAAFAGQHSATVDSVILVAGVAGGPAGWAGHNGEQKVTAVGPGLVRFATTLPDGTYTGTISIKMAPAGWSKVFAATGIAVYQSTDPQSSKMLLRVDDTNALFVRVRGFESMTDANAGLGAFPSNAQINGGGFWPKSINENSVPVGWSVACDTRLFYISTQPGISSGADRQIGNIRVFGDLVPFRASGDPYACLLNCSTRSASYYMLDGCASFTNSGLMTTPRSYTGLGSSEAQVMTVWGQSWDNSLVSGITEVHGAFPNPIDGGLYLSKRFIALTRYAPPRAELPGSYHMMQSRGFGSFRSGDMIPGAGALTGRKLMAVTGGNNTNFDYVSTPDNTSITFIDVTGPWR